MSKELTPRTLHDLFRKDSQRIIFFAFTVMIATALYFAVVSGLAIGKGIVFNNDWEDYLVRVPYWCVSALAVCMVYLKLLTYSRFITHPMTVLDVIIPLAKAFVASSLFAVLSQDDKTTWFLWPLVFSLFAAVSHLKIRYYLSKFDERNVSFQAAALIRMIKENSRKTDLRATLFFSLAFFAIWILLNFVPPPEFMAHWSPKLQALLALPSGLGMIMAVKSDSKIRAEVLRLKEAGYEFM